MTKHIPYTFAGATHTRCTLMFDKIDNGKIIGKEVKASLAAIAPELMEALQTLWAANNQFDDIELHKAEYCLEQAMGQAEKMINKAKG